MNTRELAEPALARAVRCGTCGANTLVRGAGRTECVYCGMPVELPADVQPEAARFEVRAELARSIANVESELASESPGWARGLAVFQFAGMMAWLVSWVDLLSRYHRSPSGAQIFSASSAFLCPYLFWRIASDQRKDKELRQLAKLSFAQLEAAPLAGGPGFRLSCPGCGGAVHAAQIDGLTIRCTQCNNPMLAPAQLVEDGQRHVLQQVIVLRQRLLGKSESSALVTLAVGFVYVVVGIVGWSTAELGGGDDLNSWIAWPHLFSMSMFLYWLATHRKTDPAWVRPFIGGALPLGPLMALVLFYLDMASKAPH